MGLLANELIPAWHPAPQPVREAALAIRLACAQFAVETGTVRLHLCLKRPVVASTLVGVGCETEVEGACAALDWTAPEELMQTIQRNVAPVDNVVWPSGRDENQDLSALTKEICDAPR